MAADPWPALRSLALLLGLVLALSANSTSLSERPGRDGIRALEERVSARLRETQPSVEPIRGPIAVRAFDLTWTSPSQPPILKVDSIIGTLSPGKLLSGDVVVSSLDIFGPTAELVYLPSISEWNYQVALDRLLGPEGPSTTPHPEPPAEHLVVFEDVTVNAGKVLVRPPSGDSIRISDLSALIPRFAFSGPDIPEPEATLSRLAATLEIDARSPPLTVTVLDAGLRIPTGGLVFSGERVEVESSIFSAVSGRLVFDEPGLGLTLEAHAERLALADLRPFTPTAPAEGVATFDLGLSTSRTGRYALRVEGLLLNAMGSRIRGSFGLAFGADLPPAPLAFDLALEPLSTALIEEFSGPLPYHGEVRGWVRGPPERIAFQLNAVLAAPGVAEPFNSVLSGAASFTGESLRLTFLEVDLQEVPLIALRPLVPGLAREGTVSGTIRLEGLPNEAPIRVDLALRLAAGSLNVAGTIDLSGARPSYDLNGRANEILLAELLEVAVPPVRLTARFTVVGSGLQPGTASARVQLEGHFTGWQSRPDDSIQLQAFIDRGRLELDRLHLGLATLELDASGSWHFEPPTSGGIDYRLTASSLEPFAPYLGAGIQSGPLLAVGTITGPLAAPVVAGRVDGARLAYGAWVADTLSASYDLVLRTPLTEAEVRLTAQGIGTPLGNYSSALLNLVIADSEIAIDLFADGGQENGPVVLTARGVVEPGGRYDIELERFQFDLGEGSWRLASPARILWEPGPVILVDNLLLRAESGTGSLAINGVYPPSGSAELQVAATSVPLAEALLIAGYQPLFSGLLSLDLRVHGPPDDPGIDGSFTIADGSYHGQDLGLVQGSILVEERRLDAFATADLDSAGSLRIDASVPIDIGLGGVPSFELLQGEPLGLTLTADSLALRLLALSIPEIRNVEGRIDARVEVTGTPAEPRLTGRATLEDGSLRVLPLDQSYDQITAELVLDDQTIWITNLAVHSGGWAMVSGTIGVSELSDPTFDLHAEFDRFQAVGAEQYEPAEVRGDLTLTGSLEEPVVAGHLTLDGGSLAITQFQTGATPLSADLPATTTIASPPDTAGFPTTLEGESLLDRVIFDDLLVTAGQNFWVVADEFRAQLAGELVLHKVEDGLEIFGSLEGNRGTFTLRAGPLVRRFTLSETSVRFFGTPEIDPALDITASRLIPGPDGQLNEIVIHLTGTLKDPHVTVTTGTGAAVPESELLSFLLFGRPSLAAPGQLPVGGPLLEEAVFGIGSLAELASIGLEEAISTVLGLPLDYFMIQPNQGPMGGLGSAIIVIGQEIAPNLFLTVNTGVGGLFGGTASANSWSISLIWRITPEWSLEIAAEPVNPARFFQGLGTALPSIGLERQLIVELRRRWTY